jgi:hypothetical protein
MTRASVAVDVATQNAVITRSLDSELSSAVRS